LLQVIASDCVGLRPTVVPRWLPPTASSIAIRLSECLRLPLPLPFASLSASECRHAGFRGDGPFRTA
jgi:hypothetical protein